MRIVVYPEQLNKIKRLMDANKKIQAIGYAKEQMRTGGIIIGLVSLKLLVEGVYAGNYVELRHFECSLFPKGAVVVSLKIFKVDFVKSP